MIDQSLYLKKTPLVTFRATGSSTRSNCSLVCKTSYVPTGVTKDSNGFDKAFLTEIGLDDLAKDGTPIGGGKDSLSGIVLTAGLPVGRGLTKDAAVDMGLLEGTPVGSGVIDA